MDVINSMFDIFSEGVIVEELIEQDVQSYNNITIIHNEWVKVEPQRRDVAHDTFCAQVGAIVAEAMVANPQMCEVFPCTEDVSILSQVMPNSQTFEPVIIEVEDVPIGTMIDHANLQDGVEARCELTFTSEYEDDSVFDYGSMMKGESFSKFQLEEEHQFPIAIQQFPHIIRQIEDELTCVDRFNFRSAFSNVCIDDQSSIEVEQSQRTTRRSCSTVEEYCASYSAYFEPQEDLVEYVGRRRHICICQTVLYRHMFKLRRFGRMMRIIFNNHLTLQLCHFATKKIRLRTRPTCKTHISEEFLVRKQEIILDNIQEFQGFRRKCAVLETSRSVPDPDEDWYTSEEEDLLYTY